jgi:adenine-specific DNA-methyltransferase
MPKPRRLNYIGSKYLLLEWLETNIREKTGWGEFQGKRIGDLFSGTGIFSYHFRKLGAATIGNDSEPYSATLTEAMSKSVYTPFLQEVLDGLNKDLDAGKHQNTVGFITRSYSPFQGQERMFFTIDNARRIDYCRAKLQEMKPTLTAQDYNFLLASLLVAADSISNVPAVYGCYLKNFKAKAKKALRLEPVHTWNQGAHPDSAVFQGDILDPDLFQVSLDAVYLDPPYNERQYSKNYFPLNMIVSENTNLETLKGKTGIPDSSFVSPFCKKNQVREAFELLVSQIQAPWIFLSYNSESLISRKDMEELLGQYGQVSVVERDYKRFKSFQYNKTKPIREYLFCLRKI